MVGMYGWLHAYFMCAFKSACVANTLTQTAPFAAVLQAIKCE